MIENSIKQFRARRSSSRRVDTNAATKQRLGLAQREIANSQYETGRMLQQGQEAIEAQYSPAEAVGGWADNIAALRAERQEGRIPENEERSTTGALSTVDGPTRPVARREPTRPRARSETSAAYAEELKNGLIDRGMPVHIAEGFVMNFQDESGLDPSINETTPLVAGSRGGFGLYQLTGSRRTEYEAMADGRGVAYEDTDAQLDWLMSEYTGSESSAAARINETTTAGEAAAAIVKYFLRPSPEHVESRSARYLAVD